MSKGLYLTVCSVPNKVEQLFKAQEFHDRKQRLARSKLSKQEASANPATDFFRFDRYPMVASNAATIGR
jgi:isocitrate lyase